MFNITFTWLEKIQIGAYQGGLVRFQTEKMLANSPCWFA